MASLNHCTFIGNLGSDPELRYTPSGSAIANMSLGVTESWKDGKGEKQERTEWIRISFFGKTAEVISKYCHKGSAVYVTGSWHTNKWTDKEGNDRYSTEIRGRDIQFLSPSGGNKVSEKPRQQQAPEQQVIDDDIPF